jgi:hypothetical protein
MFGWLARIFKKKEKKEEPKETVELPAQSEPAQTGQKQPIPAKTDPSAPDRPEKTCAKCGAPNDTFVDVCWMCKEKI